MPANKPSRAQQRAARRLADQQGIGYTHALAVIRGDKPSPVTFGDRLTDAERNLVLQAISDFADAVADMLDPADRDDCEHCDGTGTDEAGPASCSFCNGSGFAPEGIELALEHLETAIIFPRPLTDPERALMSDVLSDYQSRVDNHCDNPEEAIRLNEIADAAGGKLGV